jgi:hypothetical protein
LIKSYSSGLLVFLKQMPRLIFLISFLCALFIISCKKDSFTTSPDAKISFSADTIQFDTVFATTATITQSFKIINLNGQKLTLSTIRLAGGQKSPFKININGAPVTQSNNVVLEANDSLYVFVTVYVDPSGNNLPFVLQDSIEIDYNGNQSWVQLQAWGQNAHFLKNTEISKNTVWPNDLPYVILGGLLIDSATTLTIQPGCRIYFHANAPMLVNGTLQVLGQKYDSTRVSFQSDRLDKPYSGFPGSWPGIVFQASSVDNLMQYTSIKNAYQAIVVAEPSANNNPKLSLKECVIDNAYSAGILGIHTSIYAENCLISNCGSNIVLSNGGSYQFLLCTVVGYSNTYVLHDEPVLTIANYPLTGISSGDANLNSQFSNCIFWGEGGNVDDEVQLASQGDSLFSAGFANCIWKSQNFPSLADTSKIFINQDPDFQLIDNSKLLYDFRLKAGSPAIDKGLDLGITIDLDGNPRPVNLPDLGAYEKQ